MQVTDSLRSEIHSGQKGFNYMPRRPRMCISPETNCRSVDLTTDDLRAIIESTESQSAFWRIRATYASGPRSRSSGTRWAYVFWAGPPSEDIVPAVAITRHVAGYRIIILDALELFASGTLEAMECTDLGSALELVREFISEAQEIALDRAVPDLAARIVCLEQLRRPSGEEHARQTIILRDLILDLMSTDVRPS